MGLLRLFTFEMALERVQNKAGSASVSKIGRIMGDPWGIVSQHLHACMRACTHTHTRKCVQEVHVAGVFSGNGEVEELGARALQKFIQMQWEATEWF